jgi:MFS family permease
MIAGWSGFFLMAIELLSGRLLAPNFGGSIQVWGAVITVFMLALSIGYLVGGSLSVKNPSLGKLSLMLLGTAALTTPTVIFGERITEAVFQLVLDPRYGSLLAAFGLFFVPTLLAGMVSPYAVRLLVQESRLSGQGAGILYFVSTFGSAAGTLLTSFYLVLVLDVMQIFWILIAVSTALGLLTLAYTLLPFKTAGLEQKGL